ncbi:MAG: head decoration protein [Nitrososphaerota archaeon]
MATVNEGRYVGDWLKFEEDNFYSRETVTVASGSNLDTGTVVGKVTATGKVKQINFSATDGSENAYGILYSKVDASTGDAKGVCIVRHAIVVADELIWPDGATSDQKQTALSQLAEKGIISRDGI